MKNLIEYDVIHITETGMNAGRPWCGYLGRYDLEKEGFTHYGLWINKPELRSKLCKGCNKILTDIENDEEEIAQ